MDKKLILLCRLHDEICEIGKTINTMFSFQMLLTMAYGFLNTTAQFYFLYCGLMGQVSNCRIVASFAFFAVQMFAKADITSQKSDCPLVFCFI
jgi:7tm Chemosensory receptor